MDFVRFFLRIILFFFETFVFFTAAILAVAASVKWDYYPKVPADWAQIVSNAKESITKFNDAAGNAKGIATALAEPLDESLKLAQQLATPLNESVKLATQMVEPLKDTAGSLKELADHLKNPAAAVPGPPGAPGGPNVSNRLKPPPPQEVINRGRQIINTAPRPGQLPPH